MPETETPAIPALLRGEKAFQAAWKPILLQWIVPGWGYWVLGLKGRAKAFFAVWGSSSSAAPCSSSSARWTA